MPGKSRPFTPSSILFRPHRLLPKEGEMVEAPGTAPGSDGFITIAIYRHSPCGQGLYKRSRWSMQRAGNDFGPASDYLSLGRTRGE